EEVLAEEWNQQERERDAAEEARDEDLAANDNTLEKGAVRAADPLESALEASLKAGQDVAGGRCMLVMGFQQVHRHGRHERLRQDKGGEHSEAGRLREGDEEITRDPGQEEHRNEHNADTESGNQNRNGDLGTALQDGVAQVMTFLKVTLDVLDRDGGIVDQDADGQRQAAER